MGIDINEAAIRVAAFSLYLAFLDFIDPPNIRRNKKLPKLIYSATTVEGHGKNFFNLSAFCLTKSELEAVRQKKCKETDIFKDDEILPFEDKSFDVIVGNPPWGSAKGSTREQIEFWSSTFDYPIGDYELSQSFVWRTQKLLRPGGEIGLLVSSGIIFKHSKPSKEFRRRWLSTSSVRAVYNFSHVRDVFFSKQKKAASAPFLAVFFRPEIEDKALQNRVTIIPVMQNAFVNNLQVVIIDKSDLHKITQADLLANEWLWKTYMWGNLNDAELISEMKSCYQPLNLLINEFFKRIYRR